jgi:Fe-S-cluster containining protein
MVLETTEWGWWYAAPIDEKRAVAVFMTDSDLDKGDSQVAWYKRLEDSRHVSARFGNLELVEKPLRVAAGFSLLVPAYGDGWSSVGESFAAFDPLSNLGLGRAAAMGMALGHLFVDAAQEGKPPDLLTLSEYVGAEFKAHSEILLNDYRNVHRFPRSKFWARRVGGGPNESPLRVRSQPGAPQKLIFPEGQRFECSQCGKCCRSGWVARVDIDKRSALRKAYADLVGTKEGRYSALRVLDDGRVATNLTDDKHCVFLEDTTSNCNLQETGHKPGACQQFPFMLRETPDGVVVGLSFLCTSVQKNEGKPLSSYADEIREMLANKSPNVLPRNVSVSWGRGIAWEEYGRLERYLLSGNDLIQQVRSLRWYLAQWLSQPAPNSIHLEGPVPIDWLQEIENHMAFYLVSQLEAELPERRQDILNGLLENSDVTLEKADWSGAVGELTNYLGEGQRGWLQSEVDRFMKALITRKFLLLNTPLFHNLLLLSTLPQILLLYTIVNADKRSVQEIAKEDYYKALDFVEMNVTAYARHDATARKFFQWHLELQKQITV